MSDLDANLQALESAFEEAYTSHRQELEREAAVLDAVLTGRGSRTSGSLLNDLALEYANVDLSTFITENL